MNLENALEKYKAYFIEKIEMHGTDPKGVDYNGSEAQENRFAQLVKVVNPSAAFSIIDYGCGYGAFFDFLQKKNWQFTYTGIDMIEKMVAAGKEAYKDYPNARFFHSESDLAVSDYLVAGSIFNNKFEADIVEWQNMVVATLRRMNGLCSKGFAFNMLTKYSDKNRMAQHPDLFYADPLFFFDFCKCNFSRNVALLHDYGLYDFTILVRKDV
jgi:SAM-dependent methyltransferase